MDKTTNPNQAPDGIERCVLCGDPKIYKYGGKGQPLCEYCAYHGKPFAPPPGFAVSGRGHTLVRTEPKIKRNEPCPCGSGKKFKNCHLLTDVHVQP